MVAFFYPKLFIRLKPLPTSPCASWAKNRPSLPAPIQGRSVTLPLSRGSWRGFGFNGLMGGTRINLLGSGLSGLGLSELILKPAVENSINHST